MKIKINELYTATKNFNILGYVGETNARTIDIVQPAVSGADTYRLRFEYNDGTVYDVPITDGSITLTASILREAGAVSCQWIATKSNGDSFDLVAKSQVFELRIGESIIDDVAPIPTYEQSQSMLDQLNEGINSKITEPEQDGTSGQVLATDGNGGRYWLTVQGGGGSGENGATFTPAVSPEGVISWTNDKDLPNPEPVNIKGEQGEQGERGEKGDTGEQGIQGIQGEKGEKGDNGVGISNASINNDGELVITLTDSASINVGKVVGADGQSGSDGVDGISVTGATVNGSGDLVLSLSNSTTVNAGHVVGANGADGDDYVLTENDKSEIADIAIGNIADGDERRYPQ